MWKTTACFSGLRQTSGWGGRFYVLRAESWDVWTGFCGLMERVSGCEIRAEGVIVDAGLVCSMRYKFLNFLHYLNSR